MTLEITILTILVVLVFSRAAFLRKYAAPRVDARRVRNGFDQPHVSQTLRCSSRWERPPCSKGKIRFCAGLAR
jgi:hypothetical protein